MNKRKVHKILSWLLLLFFAVGQLTVYAHQHHTKYNALGFDNHHASKHQIVQEKCTFCDQMHQAHIICVHPPDYAVVLTPVLQNYAQSQHHYKGNSLVHADGLSPPALV